MLEKGALPPRAVTAEDGESCADERERDKVAVLRREDEGSIRSPTPQYVLVAAKPLWRVRPRVPRVLALLHHTRVGESAPWTWSDIDGLANFAGLPTTVVPMDDDQSSLLVEGSFGRAVLAELVGFDDFAVYDGIDLATKVDEATTRLGRLASCDEPLALLSALQCNPMGFGFSPGHREWTERLSTAGPLLLPIAEALVQCPAASWWWSPVDRGEQRWLSCTHSVDRLPRGETIEVALERAVEKEIAEQADPGRIEFYEESLQSANHTGHWWSGPLGAEVVYTSRSGPEGLPSTQLATMEDHLVSETFHVWATDLATAPRVCEVQRPPDWARLVDLAPLDVTVTRDPDWSRWSGRHGPWFVPD